MAACALSLPLTFPLSFRIRGGKCRRADSRSFSRTRISPSARFHPRTLAKSPRGARLVENRRLGDDYRRHMQRIHGTLDASIFFPPGRLVDA